MSTSRILLAALSLSALGLTLPAAAQPGHHGGPGWGGPPPGGRDAPVSSRGRDSREGRVHADSFVAEGAGDLLGHGAISVVAAPGGVLGASNEANYEAAVVDQLVKAGYDTTTPGTNGGQVAELTIVRDVIEPAEQKRSPVSGAVTMGTSNHGSMMGMTVDVDMTKPKKALLSTRIEARIRDHATGKPLWEGRALIITREGDEHWSEQAIAARLAGALFEHFPGNLGSREAR